jgi:putative solute:sodium symporter small subunit
MRGELGGFVTEEPSRDRHRRRTLILAAAVLAAVFAVVAVAAMSAAGLNAYRVLRLPLGFYLLAQGLLFAIVAMGFWFARRQDRIDDERSESESL